MIGTFWNLCRACPAMPFDKNRSEYRSTYQWYEYTGPRQQVAKQVPQLTLPINSIHPEVNIKSNPIFENKEDELRSKLRTESQTPVTINTRARLISRNDRRDYAHSRRSKSEGPPDCSSRRRQYRAVNESPSPDHNNEAPEFETDCVVINDLINEYEAETTSIPLKASRGNTEYRLQFAWPKTKNSNDNREEIKTAGSSFRRSAFMTTMGRERPPVPVHKKRFHQAEKKNGVLESEPPSVNQVDHYENQHVSKKEKNGVQSNERLKFHSEYRKNFRPFSQYDYISGKFSVRDISMTPSSNLGNAAWYAEVVELRKKASEYKHRGWGTELVPQHLAEVYNEQIALWEHVSRRSSLSALILATTTHKPKALTKEEKSKENSRKSQLHTSRQASVERATSASYKKTEQNEELKRCVSKIQKDANAKDGASAGKTQLSGSLKIPVSRTNSPKKTNIFGASCQEKHIRPKVDETARAEKTIEANITETEKIIKSPPEPTRVKSPEPIMMKPPEPVNWTVPLDTGKTFTVTQNIYDGDVCHHRPPSDMRLLSSHYGSTYASNNVDISASKNNCLKTDNTTVPTLSSELHDKPCDKLPGRDTKTNGEVRGARKTMSDSIIKNTESKHKLDPTTHSIETKPLKAVIASDDESTNNTENEDKSSTTSSITEQF